MDSPAFEIQELRRNVGRPRHDEDCLSESRVAQQRENLSGPSRIELGERIVEQQHRCETARLANRRALQHSQRDRGRSLLSGRAEESEVAAVEGKREVLPVGAGVRDSSAYVMSTVAHQRLRKRAPNVIL